MTVATYNLWNVMFQWDVRKYRIADMVRTKTVTCSKYINIGVLYVGFSCLTLRYAHYVNMVNPSKASD